ncbi:MAG: ABC transporter substrate-binding protein [Actinomycetota bacterium]
MVQQRIALATLVLALFAAACGTSASVDEADAGQGSVETTVPRADDDFQSAGLVDADVSTTDVRVDLDEVTSADDVVPVPEGEVVIDEGAFPRTVDHVFGPSEIPTAPKRIVALAGVADFDALLSLGVVPYAAASYYPQNFRGERGFAPWNTEYTGEIETFISAGGAFSLEALAALEPDLIVGQEGSVGQNYDRYAEIAPTVLHGYPTDWREPIRIFGEALALEDEAAAAIARIEAEIQVIADRVPEDPPAVAMVSPFAFGEVTIYNENLGAGPALALTEIGIPIVGPDGPISMERLGELDEADWIVVFDFALSDVDGFLEDPIFQQLSAAQEGNVVRLSPEQSFSWVLETSRSLPATLDGILTSIGL